MADYTKDLISGVINFLLPLLATAIGGTVAVVAAKYCMGCCNPKAFEARKELQKALNSPRHATPDRLKRAATALLHAQMPADVAQDMQSAVEKFKAEVDTAENEKEVAVEARDAAVREKEEANEAKAAAVATSDAAVLARDAAVREKEEAIEAKATAVATSEAAVLARDAALREKEEANKAKAAAVAAANVARQAEAVAEATSKAAIESKENAIARAKSLKGTLEQQLQVANERATAAEDRVSQIAERLSQRDVSA